MLNSSDALDLTIRRLSLCQNLDEVMAVIRTAARQMVGADGATFVLRDGDHVYYADEDAIRPLWKGRRFPMTACISGWSILHRVAVMIPDVYLDERIPHDAYGPTFVKSLVITPIGKEEPIGAIGCYWSVRYWATAEEMTTLQDLANATAVALHRLLSPDAFPEHIRVHQNEQARSSRLF
jgi:GAF domain-containing protein